METACLECLFRQAFFCFLLRLFIFSLHLFARISGLTLGKISVQRSIFVVISIVNKSAMSKNLSELFRVEKGLKDNLFDRIGDI